MKRGGLLTRRRKPRPPEGPLSPEMWAQEAYRRARWHSQLSGLRVTRAIGEVHHVVPKRWLRANGYHSLVWDPDNAMVLTKAEHEAHENGSRRIPRDTIPDYAMTFAATLGEPALVEVERHHPQQEGAQ